MRCVAAFLLASIALFCELTVDVKAQTVDPLDMLFVTDDDARNWPGCDRIVVVDAANGRHVAEGDYRPSPGRLSSTSDGRIVVSTNNNNAAFVTALLGTSDFRTRWTSFIISRPVLVGGPVSFSPNDEMLLVARPTGIGRYWVRQFDRTTIGREEGRFELSSNVSSILFTSDSATAVLIRVDGEVDFIDPVTMLAKLSSLTYSPIPRPDESKLRKTFAAISPDDRYIVINSGSSRISVLDLTTHTSFSVDLEGVTATYGVGFNHRSSSNLLAVNGRSAVAVYDFDPNTQVRLLARIGIPPQDPDDLDATNDYMDRPSSLTWTGRGDGVVAAIGGQQEFRILDFREEDVSSSLTRRLDFDGCKVPMDSWQTALDVVSLNDRYHPPPPSSTTTPSQPKLFATADQLGFTSSTPW